MNIAQIAPLTESVSPGGADGTERAVSLLTEELVRLGHQVTVFASGDSVTNACLEPMCPRALRGARNPKEQYAALLTMLERVFLQADRFDVIHSHVDMFAFPLLRRVPTPVVATVYSRLNLPELAPVYREFTDIPLVSISRAQRRWQPGANWKATIYHGLPSDLYTFHSEPGRYLAFLGRLSPRTRPDVAVDVAKRVGLPLRLAGTVDPADSLYFDEVIRPLLDRPLIDYVGERADAERRRLLGHACALVCPADWPEPSGLALIEALACGTPVVAFRRGPMPEIIEDGVTGFLCDSLDDMVGALRRLRRLDRRRCREAFERRFTVDRMAQAYVDVYNHLVAQVRGRPVRRESMAV